MTKSELIEKLSQRQSQLTYKDVEFAVKTLTEQMAQTLPNPRISIRPPRIGRNPKTGEAVSLAGKYVPHFKPGKELRERVNNAVGQ